MMVVQVELFLRTHLVGIAAVSQNGADAFGIQADFSGQARQDLV